MCHGTKLYRAATVPSLIEVAARLRLVVWLAYYSPPALVASKTGGSRRRQRAAVPVGTKKMVSLHGPDMALDKYFAHPIIYTSNTLHIK